MTAVAMLKLTALLVFLCGSGKKWDWSLRGPVKGRGSQVTFFKCPHATQEPELLSALSAC